MKRIATLLIALGAMIATSAFAATVTTGTIGIVNMQQIFQSAPQVQKINNDLKSKFASRKDKLVAQGKTLQADIDKYQKNKSVMKPADATKLQDKIQKESDDLRQAQTQFQQDLFAAQNTAMHDFMGDLNTAVSAVAKKDNISVVLPDNNVIYADSKLDITADVLKQLK